MKKIAITFSLTTVLFSLTSCFSTYPIQKQFPCEDSTREEKIEMIGDAIKSEFNPKNLVLNDDGVSYLKFDYKFDNILYVRAKMKSGITGKKYWIQIKEFNGEMNVIYLKDHSLMEKANNALMCLANLQSTNGRPNKNGTPSLEPSKYDNIKKLNELLKSGAITQEEFDTEKKKILNK